MLVMNCWTTCNNEFVQHKMSTKAVFTINWNARVNCIGRSSFVSIFFSTLIVAILLDSSLASLEYDDVQSKYSDQIPPDTVLAGISRSSELSSTSINVENSTTRQLIDHLNGSMDASSDHSTTNLNSLQANAAAMTMGNNSIDETIADGLCKLATISRRVSGSEVELDEMALTCSNVDNSNYKQILEYVVRRRKLDLQQIEIKNSESLVVFSIIDLICSHFNCSKLTVFNLTGTKIHSYNVLCFWLATWSQIELLDLSNTSLVSLESIMELEYKHPITLPKVNTLLLDHNYISQLNFTLILDRMPNLKHLSLVDNSIFDIYCNEHFIPRLKSQIFSVALANNSINCDRDQLWLMKQFISHQTSSKYPEYEQIKCGSPERLVDMTWNQRVSVLETPICDGCDCKSTKKTAISVNCNNKNLTALPDVLPINTKILNLTSNRITSIGVPYNSKNWENVTYVYLENNLITSFQPLEINSKFMTNLAALDIRKNKFQEFPSHIFEQFINLDQVHLSNNPWLCDCEPTFAFQEWLQRQFQKVGDKEEIRCGVSGSEENGVGSSGVQQRLSARVIYRLSKSELCPQDNLEEPYDWLDALNIFLCLTIVFMLLKVTVDYIYQHRTKRLPHFFKINH